VYCAECDAGCNYHSKNTIDLNYLYVAEHRYRAEVRTEHLATQIVPLNAKGEDDLQADGSSGYRVAFIDLTTGRATQSVLANRVVLSAGTLGSGELLLRCKREKLPRLSDRLGQRFSGNGDFLGFVIGTKPVADPNYGPVITQGIDYNLLENFDRDRAFILEDASYPAFLAWFVEGVKPGPFRLGAIGRTIRAVWDRFTGGALTGSIGYALGDLLRGDLSHHTAVLLSMGVDKSNGLFTLDANGCLDLSWPTRDSMPLYKAINNANRAFRDATAAADYIPLPTWLWPLRKNVTVHSLGGCVLADDASNGVTSADRATFGQAFGYRNLFVADGAIVPTAVGANPIATISALSEMVAEGITGIAPTADL
jgi:cholesterol oxidase